jgi:hypothetical protein
MTDTKEDLPTYEQALQEQPQPPQYTPPRVDSVMASITRTSRSDDNPIYEDLNNVVDTTEFDDVDQYDYDQLANVVNNVSLDADKSWMA